MTALDSSPTVQIHIDLDTPHILNRFYQGPQSDHEPDDNYCQTLLQRVGDFFNELGIKATFFVITKDLQLPRYGTLLKVLQTQGHEMAAHSHTHPYFHPGSLEELMREEIQTSFREMSSFFQEPPKGYRSPGFYITDVMIPMLIEAGFKYDSSSFHAPLVGLLNWGAKLLGASTQYGQTAKLKPIMHESFKEFPLPSSFGLPFYHNLNLCYPRPLQGFLTALGVNRRCSPYLFHLIEFADFEADQNRLPRAIWKHPNLKQPLKQKLKFTRKLMARFKRRFPITLSGDSV